MFPQKNRFTTRLDGSFFREAKKIYSPAFVLYLKKSTNGEALVTVIVPKKVVARSTKRSEMKRLMRNSLIPYLEKLGGFEVVLYLKSLQKDGSRKTLRGEIEDLVKRI